MEIKSMPKETLAELLFFLAENEEFTAVEKSLAEGVSVEEVRAGLRELGEALRREAAQESAGQYNAQKDRSLTKETKTIISYLSPGEEKTLLTAFGLIDKTKTLLG
ncbi:MAG: hypothetical protein A3H42_05045 [Deltaproteobacteria bacterium RIFCSPLOWO2_02_FULL_46_8]|nr:MAG: hypothetical protein A3H42_05045 [Deltaproteobacteria bacterium RIFCSPLOWO2_02_FULL_46_8]